MKVLNIVNQKGGVGKTTTAVTVAHGMSQLGLNVLLIDLDAQGNCADALGDQKRAGLYDLLISERVQDSITFDVRERLDCIYSDKRTVEVKSILAGKAFREYSLKNALDDMGGYDVVVLDCAPGADLLQINALIAATHFIIPVSLAHLATVGAVDVLGTVSSLKKVGAFNGQWMGVLPTLWDRTTNESQRQLSEMVQHFGRVVWPPIPLDVKARESPAHGQTLWEYAPGCRALTGVKLNGRFYGGYKAVLERLIKELELEVRNVWLE